MGVERVVLSRKDLIIIAGFFTYDIRSVLRLNRCYIITVQAPLSTNANHKKAVGKHKHKQNHIKLGGKIWGKVRGGKAAVGRGGEGGGG